MFKNLFWGTNDHLSILIAELTIFSVIIIQIYGLLKIKEISKKYYLFVFIKILEIIFVIHEFFYMYFVLFFIGIFFNAIFYKIKNIPIKEAILGLILFSGVPLIIFFYIFYLIPLKFFYEYLL